MARKSRPPEILSGEGAKLFEALNEGIDIACALIGAAALEQAVMSLLHKFLIQGETSESFFRLGGTLGDFSNCCKMAYCLGLIPKGAFNNLCTIGEIRNRFAHSHLQLDFSDAELVKMCERLVLPGPPFDHLAANARSRYQLIVVMTWTRLVLNALSIERQKKAESPPIKVGPRSSESV
jgi:DNA-binding MltR family transcriptional regulator